VFSESATRLARLVLSALLLLSPLAQAQERHHDNFRGHEFREHDFHDHRYLDARYHHNHYYPPYGFAFGVLPPGHVAIWWGGVRFYFSAGVWYRYQPPAGYVVVAPPVGAVVPGLPPYYTMVWVNGAPYYYANNAYYLQTPQGYVVTAPPPPNVYVEQAPPSSAPPPPASPPPPPQAAPQPADRVFAYPMRGQTQQQQSADRGECQRWAAQQTGADTNASNSPDYRRAMTACLEARGYTVR
jgi:hypothetical protein